MHTEIVDEKTFIVGGKSYEVDDALELSEDEEALLAKIREMETQRDEITQMLVTTCHMAEKNFVPEIRQPAHDYATLTLELSYQINIVFVKIEARIGGILPLQFNEEKTKILVRERDLAKREELNYTVNSVMRSLAMTDWSDQRKMAIHMADEKKENVNIDCSVAKEFGIQPIVAPLPDVFGILKAAATVLEKSPGLQSTIILTKAGVASIFPKDTARPAPKRWQSIVRYAKHIQPESLVFITRKSVGTKNEFIELYASFMHKDAKIKPFHHILKLTLTPRETETSDQLEGFGAPQEELYAQLLS
jgi:hypothetical protein